MSILTTTAMPRKSVFINYLAFLYSIIILALPFSLHAEKQRQQLDVLAIHSYHQDYPWTESQYGTYKDRLVELLPAYSVNFSTEYLNTKRISPSEEYKTSFFKYIREKYNNNEPDLIYVTDDNALKFVISNTRQSAWKTPVVFSGINNTDFNPEGHGRLVAGVFEVKDVHSSIHLANLIGENNSKIIFIGDGGTTDGAIKNLISNGVYENNNLDIVHVSDTSLDTLIEEINTIGDGIIILTTVGRVRDSNGDLLELKSIIEAITNTGKKVLVMEDSYLFPGVLGGYVTSSHVQGKTAAQISERIVRGKPPRNPGKHASELILSLPDAKRLGIDINKGILSKARLINLPISLTDRYPALLKWLLWFVAILILILFVFIFNSRHKSRLLKEQYTDPVTCLPNRVKLLSDIKKSAAPCLSIIDINNFKSINNLYGLGVGDHLLKLLGEKLRRNVDRKYLLYRIGGNQFAILNKDHNVFSEYCFDIKTLLNNIQNDRYQVDELDISLTLTAGIIDSNEREFLIPQAEQALQQAKDNNKDYIVLEKHEQDTDRYKKNILWAQKLNKALIDSRIVPYYQPIVCNKTKQIYKYEALARLVDDGKIVPPAVFMEAAKTTRQYSTLTKMMIEKTFKAVADVPVSISVNFSVDDIKNEDTIAFFKEKLDEYHVADKVIVELTESEGIENYTEVAEFISDIKKLGCRVAIDDFGTGYSNFTHLIHLNVDYLKIDGSIIQNILLDKNAEIVARTLVQFARQLEIETIAEFVDSEEILNKVTELDIDYSQGYFLGKPNEILMH